MTPGKTGPSSSPQAVPRAAVPALHSRGRDGHVQEAEGEPWRREFTQEAAQRHGGEALEKQAGKSQAWKEVRSHPCRAPFPGQPSSCWAKPRS